MIHVAEVARIRTPLGVRFWDAVSDRVVVDGLTVEMRKRLPNGSMPEAMTSARPVFSIASPIGRIAAIRKITVQSIDR